MKIVAHLRGVYSFIHWLVQGNQHHSGARVAPLPLYFLSEERRIGGRLFFLFSYLSYLFYLAQPMIMTPSALRANVYLLFYHACTPTSYFFISFGIKAVGQGSATFGRSRSSRRNAQYPVPVAHPHLPHPSLFSIYNINHHYSIVSQ